MAGAAVATAVKCKDAGNSAFAQQEYAACVKCYAEGLAVIGDATDAAALQVKATLLSNTANAQIAAENWASAATAGERAVAAFAALRKAEGADLAAVTPLEDKARLRAATALQELGCHFAALVKLLQLSTEGSNLPAAQKLRFDAAKAAGIDELDPTVQLRPHGDGLGMVATSDARVGAALFVEAQLLVPGIDAEPTPAMTNEEGGVTTESRVQAYVRELLRLRRLAGDEGRDGHAFASVARSMRGSWPRSWAQVPASVLKSVTEATEAIFAAAQTSEEGDAAVTARPVTPEELENTVGIDALGADAGADAERRLVLLVALQARYNCFERGFFPVCALLNHSCASNAAMKYTEGRSVEHHLVKQRLKDENVNVPMDGIGATRLEVVCPVKKGDALSVKYLSDFDFILGVLPRRELLSSSWLFTCECSRCLADLEPSAQTEWVRCTATEGCTGYVHLPLPPGDSDSAIATSCAGLTRECAACKQQCSLSKELIAEMHAVCRDIRRGPVSAMAPTSTVSVGMLYEWASALHARITRRCHPAHWLHALVLYRICVAAKNAVDDLFIRVGEDDMPLATAAKHLGLARGTRAVAPDDLPYGHADLGEGVNVLGWFAELELRIVPFYPDEQLWALHTSIARLAVLVGAAYPDRIGDVTVPLLARKAVHLQRPAARMAASILNRLPAGAAPAKDLKAALKHLK